MHPLFPVKKNAKKLYTVLTYLMNEQRKGILNVKKIMAMEKIMKKKDLQTFYQPILCMESGENVGYEILNRPIKSTLFPTTEKFYDFIGETDQMFAFEYFCRNLSIQRFSQLLKETPCEKNSLIFINIDPQALVDLTHRNAELLLLLQQYGLTPNQIVFELTEKREFSDFENYHQSIDCYRAQGFRIALDDVGSGYNCLKTLINLKPDFIKIDKSLIQFIDQNRSQQQMVELLLDFANQSGIFVIAEGIERPEEYSYLKKKGIHYGQGYALGQPASEPRPGKVPVERSLPLSLTSFHYVPNKLLNMRGV